MRLKIIFALFPLICAGTTVRASAWQQDSLGAGFEMRQVAQPDDYSGRVVCTLVRYMADSVCDTDKGVLYVHGFNDYFFQKELALNFASHCFDFYAVDLRKYGRSILPGQKMFEVRNFKEYFEDIDSALCDMQRAGIKDIVLTGHSTGGLIAAYYMQTHPQAPVKALVLNSPFLDWNLGSVEPFVPLVSAAGAVFKNMKIKQSADGVYAESIDRNYHGEWDYNRQWKRHDSPDVTVGWVRAVDNAQKSLKDNAYKIGVPVLVMYSDCSYSGKEWTEAAQSSDAVLDVADIKKYGARLGKDVTLAKVRGGLHDLILSAKPVRNSVYAYIFDWLEKQDL